MVRRTAPPPGLPQIPGIKRRDFVAIPVGERNPLAVFAAHCLGRAGDRGIKSRRSHGQSADAIVSSAAREYQNARPNGNPSRPRFCRLRTPLVQSGRRWSATLACQVSGPGSPTMWRLIASSRSNNSVATGSGSSGRVSGSLHTDDARVGHRGRAVKRVRHR
jgi:hypothetical protein